MSINILFAAMVEAAQKVLLVAGAVSPHHFESEDYKLRPLVFHHSENTHKCYTFPNPRIFYTRGDSQERNPGYNESHLYRSHIASNER